MRSNAFWVTSSMVNALRCLGGIQYGESDGMTVDDMPSAVEAVVYVLDSYSAYREVLYEGTIFLGHGLAFVLGGPHSPSVPWHDAKHPLTACAYNGTGALMQLLRARVSDAETARAVVEA